MRLKSSAEKAFKPSSLKPFNLSSRAASLDGDGMIETETLSCSALRKTICVAKRVHKVLSRGKGSSVRPSKTEDFPLDWSPTTTSCGRIVSIVEYVKARQPYLRQRNVLADPFLTQLIHLRQQYRIPKVAIIFRRHNDRTEAVFRPTVICSDFLVQVSKGRLTFVWP